MIFARRCDQTRVLNFFTAAEPLFAIGSVVEKAANTHYEWHCYLDDPVGGTARDTALAEAQLRRAIAARRHAVSAHQ
jgi:hypothetical protein